MITIAHDVLTQPGGRTVGFAASGPRDATTVLWFHGGPGSRCEPDWLRSEAADRGLQIVAVDRPGYGNSTPRPGRTIADAVADAFAVADVLGIGRAVTVGVSTGGAYALAAAAIEPDRVTGVVACCAITDARFEPARSTLSVAHTIAVWDAPDRDAAIAAAAASHGEDGSRLTGGGIDAALAASDREMFADPTWIASTMAGFPEMFRHGVQGYADDRIADRDGWVGFDVAAIRCPVTVLHGDADRMADPIHAHHTAQIVPGAKLVLVPGAGHFSVERHVVDEVLAIVGRGC